MEKVLFRTNKDEILERLVIRLALDLGFVDPGPSYGVNKGYLGLRAVKGNKQLVWIVSNSQLSMFDNPPWTIIDVGSTSTFSLIATLKDILKSAAITMPFKIHGHNVEVYPKHKIVVGCEVLSAGRIKEIVKAYAPNAGAHCPDDEGATLSLDELD